MFQPQGLEHLSGGFAHDGRLPAGRHRHRRHHRARAWDMAEYKRHITHTEHVVK